MRRDIGLFWSSLVKAVSGVGLFLGLLFFLGCQGGDSSYIEEDAGCPSNCSDGPMPMGILKISAEPEVPTTCTLLKGYENPEPLIEVPTNGVPIEITLPAGLYMFRLICPGFGYAVAGYEWKTNFYYDEIQEPVSDWVMPGKEIKANQTLTIKAVICRDLTGQWLGENDHTLGITKMRTRIEGECWAGTSWVGPSFEKVVGDIGYGGYCPSQVSVPILENGTRIFEDCDGDGSPEQVYVKVK